MGRWNLCRRGPSECVACVIEAADLFAVVGIEAINQITQGVIDEYRRCIIKNRPQEVVLITFTPIRRQH